MGFSAQQYRKQQEERPWKINPVWRGIGCFMILLIPIMAWYAAILFLQSGMDIINSPEMAKPLVVKYVHVAQIDRLISDFNTYAPTHNLTFGQFFYFILFLFLGFGLFAFLYAMIYRVIGPPRYGPFDVPSNSMRR